MSTETTTRLRASPPLSSSDLFGILEHRLTPRQLEVMALLQDGFTMPEIARKLSLSRSRIPVLRNAIRREVLRAKKTLKWEAVKAELMSNTLLSDRRGAGSLEQIVGASGQNHAKPQ